MLFQSTLNNDEYRRGNADAHRVRPPSCLPPTLVSHQAFWISHHDQSNREKERHSVKLIVDRLILEIADWTKRRHQVTVKVAPQIGGTAILFATVAFASELQVIPSLLLPDGSLDEEKLTRAQQDVLASDHRIVSIVFQLKGCKVTIRFEFHTEYFTISTFAAIANYEHPGRREFILALQSCQQLARPDSIKQELFEGFWQDLTNDICPKSVRENAVFKQMFCDFRGVVISCEQLLRPAETSTLVDHYLPLLSPIGSDEMDHECAVCFMLGKQALYMTALGPQLPHSSVDRRHPVTYLICVSEETAPWQRGGLVDLIHSAGTSRLAALKDLSALRAAGSDLAGLDSYTARARMAVSEHRRRENIQPEAVSDRIGSAHDYFGKITNDFNSRTHANYGILYRVERSRYYVQRFRANAKQMTIGSVDRFQSYDHFVEIRLGATFDFINRLGARYERGVSALALLDSYNLSIQSNEIALTQRQTEEKETEISDNIRKIQEYADFVLISVLIPYYVTALIAHVYAGPDNHETIQYFACAIWTIAFVFAMSRTNKQQRLSKRIWGALGLAATMWIFVALFHSTAPYVVDRGLEMLHWLFDRGVELIHW